MLAVADVAAFMSLFIPTKDSAHKVVMEFYVLNEIIQGMEDHKHTPIEFYSDAFDKPLLVKCSGVRGNARCLSRLA